MGTIQSTDLNSDSNGRLTSSTFDDGGDGVSRWFQWRRTANGGDVAQGATSDAAVTDPTAAGSIVAILKGILTANRLAPAGMLKAEDAAHVTGDAGVMALGVRNDTRTSLAGTTGDYSPLSVGPAGGMFANIAPEASAGWALSRVATTAAAASLVVKASPGKLYKLHVTNGSTAQFVQIFNSTTVPADTAVPIYSVRLAANESREIDCTVFGDYFSTGIAVSNSTTLATKTIGAADCWITAQFL